MPFILAYRGVLVAALAALLVASAALLALPVALRFLIDNGFASNDVETINRYFGWFFAAAAVFGGFAALRYYLVTWLGERVVADIRTAVYERVVRMDPTFFETTRTGEVLSRLTADTTLVQSVAGVTLSIALRTSVSFVGGLIMLTLTSAQLTFYILLGIPVVVAPMIIIGRRIRRQSRTTQDRVADTSGLADETLNAIQTVQAFTLEPLQSERYGRAVAESFKAAVKRVRTRAFLTALGITLVFGAITLILWAGSRAVLAGSMSGGELAQFLMYSMFVGQSAAMLSEVWGEVQRGAGAMERLIELLVARPAIRAPDNPVSLPARASGRIAFKNVTFHYPSRPDDAALEDFSLDIEPGETVAIVGPSGAGKSTSFQMLLRFYDPQAGRVEIDGIDIRQLSPADLRRRSAWCRRTPCCLVTVRGRISATVTRRRMILPLSRQRLLPQPMNSSTSCRMAMTLFWVSVVRACPVVSASGLPSRGDPERPADLVAGRGHQLTGCRERAPGATGAGGPDAAPHHAGHRPPPGHGQEGRPYRGHGCRPHRRGGQPR